MKHGPPTLFITLSCAEYHWPDIKRLLQECLKIAGSNKADEVKEGYVQSINDYTLIVQEYFQQRVMAWLKTIGKIIFGIKHHWLRYEFAPGRGQIHAHMLAITDHMKQLRIAHLLSDKSNDDESSQRKANYLSNRPSICQCS